MFLLVFSCSTLYTKVKKSKGVGTMVNYEKAWKELQTNLEQKIKGKYTPSGSKVVFETVLSSMKFIEASQETSEAKE